jgi:hypothetical protein
MFFFIDLFTGEKNKNLNKMKANLFVLAAVTITTTAILLGFNYGTKNISAKEEQMAEMPDIKSWPKEAQDAAIEMETKYGKPNDANDEMLIWNNNGVWLKTIVYKNEVKHDFPKPHFDVIEQWVNYRVKPSFYDELTMYDGSVTASRTNGTISSRCDKEGTNILALNIAYDIMNNDKTVEDARREFAENTVALANGEKSKYSQSLIFNNDKSAPDPDKPLDKDLMGKQ